MSIEQTLERIAVALEKQNEISNLLLASKPVPANPAPAASPATAPAPAPAGTTTRATKKTGMEAPKNVPSPEAQPAHDPFAQADEAPAPAISIQQLEEKLRKHAAAFGTPTTLALMVKHGADRAKTTIKSVPTAGYGPLAAEVDADLTKAKK